MAGRPSTYTQELADKICEGLASGKSLKMICRPKGMPGKATIFRWLGKEENTAFRDQYARAREAWADAMVEEVLEIADDKKIDHKRARVRIDTRKWVMGKLNGKYGDKQTIDHGVSDSLADLIKQADGSTRTL